MDLLRTTGLMLAFVSLAAIPAYADTPTSGGYVDGSMFRELIDESKEIIEVNLDGAILQAMSKGGGRDRDGDRDHDRDQEKESNIFAKLKSIHAVIGNVKGPSSEALALVQKTDRRLAASGWQRIARISNATSTITVLTHTVANRIDGLVVLIFDTEDKELVFANLAGEIDITQLGEIGERFNVPGLDQVPGSR